MRRKVIGTVDKRYTVLKHVSQWDGNQRCEVWEIIFQSDDKQEAFNVYYTAENQGGYFQVNDESLSSAKCLSSTV